MNNPYNFFDKIFCLSLDISHDRRIIIEKIFKNLNIPFEFFIVEKHPLGGLYGCFDSHIKIIKYAYKNNLENILIFEDDIIPTNSYNIENVKNIINFLQNNKDWDLFYFGYACLYDDKNGFNNILTDGNNITNNIIKWISTYTHAISYSKRSYKKILNNYKDYIGILHYDIYLSNYINHKLNSYCCIPILFDQDFNYTSNINENNYNSVIKNIFAPYLTNLKINYIFSLFRFYLNYYDIKYTIFIIILLFVIIFLLYLVLNNYYL